MLHWLSLWGISLDVMPVDAQSAHSAVVDIQANMRNRPFEKHFGVIEVVLMMGLSCSFCN